MSAEQTFSTGDLRSGTKDRKRDATRKHKWALGQSNPRGRDEDHPRPFRMSDLRSRYSVHPHLDHFTHPTPPRPGRKRKTLKAAHDHDDVAFHPEGWVDGLATQVSEDMECTSPDEDRDTAVDEDRSSSSSASPSLAATAGPSQGSQIFNTALARAIEKYEDKETTKLVRNEYDVLDVDDDAVNLGLSPVKAKDRRRLRRQAKAAAHGHAETSTDAPSEEDEYEFV